MKMASFKAKISFFTKSNNITKYYKMYGPFIYSSMYQQGSNSHSNYSCIAQFKTDHGIYVFTDSNDNIVYIGEASKQTIYKRITNHFTYIKGSLIKKVGLTILASSQFYLLISNSQVVTTKKLLFDEAYLIGVFRPIYNF